MSSSEDNSQPVTKKLKIGVLVRNFVTTGGAERYAYHVSRRLVRDHEVHIFCQTWDEKLVKGMTVHKIPRPFRKPTFVNQLFFSWFCSRVVDDSFDIIHSHERVKRFDALTIHCPCYKGFLTRSRGWRKILLWLGELTSPRGLAYLWLEKTQFRGEPERRLIADSAMVRDDVIANYPLEAEYFDVAYPGIDLEEIDQALADTDRDSLRKVHNLADDEFALLFVGTEFKRKGLDALLKGFSLLEKSKLQLLIAGAGDIDNYRKKAEQLGIDGKVTFIGKVEDIYPLYIMADAFILPTLSDPCPIAPLEAMTCGTATIMSDIPYCGTAEHVRNNEAIILKDPRDSREIAGAITEVLDPDTRNKYEKKGRELGRKLGWEHTTDIILKSFTRILEEKQAKHR